MQPKAQAVPLGAAFFISSRVLVRMLEEQRSIAAVLPQRKHLFDLRVAQRLAGDVGKQILFRDVGDVLRLRVLARR